MSTEVLGPTANAPTAWIPDDSTFGARLALIRQRMGWGNVKEAATACDVATESWRTWERDGVEPRGLNRIARKIADRTGCDYGWLVDGPALAGRGASRVTMDRNSRPAERPTTERPMPTQRRPADNRPSGHPPAGNPPGVRRTARVPRPGRH